jgi:hypothetical protein
MALGALAILASAPSEASADWLLGHGAGSSSYSPLHYWLPSLYRCRAYHRPVNYIDVAEYDLGGAGVVPAESHPSSIPEALPPPKKDVELAPMPKKDAGMK